MGRQHRSDVHRHAFNQIEWTDDGCWCLPDPDDEDYYTEIAKAKPFGLETAMGLATQ